MNGLAILLWSLLFCSVCATIKTLTSSSTTIASQYNNAKYRESSPSSGILSTVAGYKTLYEGSDVDGVPATSRRIRNPEGIAVDKEGNQFIAAYGDNKILKATASSGIITTMAGTGVVGDTGDGGQATSAMLDEPFAVALDTTGNIYIADTDNHRIRKVTVSTGVITTVAGNGNKGYASDNVAATSTSLSIPRDLTVDAAGDIYIADSGNRRIRKVIASTGIITTIAGTEKYNSKGDIATKHYLRAPTGVALDSAGNVYIAASYDNCVFKVTVSTGIITIVAGTGAVPNWPGGYNGDDILATKAQLSYPKCIAFDASDNMFINDSGNYRIRRVSASTGIITTVAGTGEMDWQGYGRSAYDGDGGSPISMTIFGSDGLAVVASGDFYFSNALYGVVKKVTYTTGTPSTSVTAAPAVAPALSSPIGTTPTVSPSSSSSSSSPSHSTPSTATAPTPSPSSSSSSISKAPAVTPSASSPSSISSAPAMTSSKPTISKAPAMPSYTLQPISPRSRSATTPVAQTLHVTMILLSSLLIHVCGF